jgi:hypothetical protein
MNDLEDIITIGGAMKLAKEVKGYDILRTVLHQALPNIDPNARQTDTGIWLFSRTAFLAWLEGYPHKPGRKVQE